jgi:hypothetical protein
VLPTPVNGEPEIFAEYRSPFGDSLVEGVDLLIPHCRRSSSGLDHRHRGERCQQNGAGFKDELGRSTSELCRQSNAVATGSRQWLRLESASRDRAVF